MGVELHKPSGDMSGLRDGNVSLSTAARLLPGVLATVAAAVATLPKVYGDYDESPSHDAHGSTMLSASSAAFFWSHIIAIHFVSAHIDRAGAGLGIFQAVHLLVVGACCQAWTNWAFLSTCIFTMSRILGVTFGCAAGDDDACAGPAAQMLSSDVMTSSSSPYDSSTGRYAERAAPSSTPSSRGSLSTDRASADAQRAAVLKALDVDVFAVGLKRFAGGNESKSVSMLDSAHSFNDFNLGSSPADGTAEDGESEVIGADMGHHPASSSSSVTVPTESIKLEPPPLESCLSTALKNEKKVPGSKRRLAMLRSRTAKSPSYCKSALAGDTDLDTTPATKEEPKRVSWGTPGKSLVPLLKACAEADESRTEERVSQRSSVSSLADETASLIPLERMVARILPSRTSTRRLMRSAMPRRSMDEDAAAPIGDGTLEILVVEDDAVQQVVVQRLLHKNGFSVKLVGSGEEAIDFMREREEEGGPEKLPAIILMDLEMPGLNGHETTEMLRQMFPTAALPIIMLTSDEGEGTVAEAMNRGANDILTKSHMKGCLMARIAAQLSTLHFWRSKLAAQKSERLLHEILPKSVIERLTEGPRLIYDEHDEVSIVFTDIVGFTDLAASVSTRELIEMLDELFNSFDTLSDQHGVYKVETIGDAYMVVAGHEASSQADHAVRAVQMAEDMVAAASRMTMPNGKPLKIRAGVHSGSAFSGVVGWKRPRFCMFGDTVNTASRMESTSFSSCVQLSSATHDLYVKQQDQFPASDHPGFACLGSRDIKGKGKMETYLAQIGDWEEAMGQLIIVDAFPSLP